MTKFCRFICKTFSMVTKHSFIRFLLVDAVDAVNVHFTDVFITPLTTHVSLKLMLELHLTRPKECFYLINLSKAIFVEALDLFCKLGRVFVLYDFWSKIKKKKMKQRKLRKKILSLSLSFILLSFFLSYSVFLSVFVHFFFNHCFSSYISLCLNFTLCSFFSLSLSV